MVHDTITRTCKNTGGDTVAVQEIPVTIRKVETANAAGMELVTQESINGTQASTGLLRFKRTGKLGLTRTTRFSNADTTITAIVTSGRYNTSTESGGETLTVTYTGDVSASENDIILGVSEHTGVLNIGDSA